MADRSNRYLEPGVRAADRTQSRVMLIGWLGRYLRSVRQAQLHTPDSAG